MVADTTKKRFREELKERFGNRYEVRPNQAADAPITVVSPTNVEEVEFLAKLADHFSVLLVPEGAGTAPKPRTPPSALSVRFELMREASVPQPPDYLVEVQPGLPWLHLEDHLQNHGRGLPVYPTSAPRATVGGWLALNGLGVGSFENGRLWENAVSVDVVPLGGGLRTVPGSELPSALKPGYPDGLIVGATLRTRESKGDAPFAAAFDTPEDLVRAVQGIRRAGVPLWHLGLLNAAMARARGHEGSPLLFGIYPEERSPEVEESLWTEIEAHEGRRLPVAEAYRVWGARFFPVSPSQETPVTSGSLVLVEQLAPALRSLEHPLGRHAVQGSVSRSGEVVLLTVDSGHERDLADVARE